MKRIFTEIEIEATPERVWGVLTDFPALREWNPLVGSVEGELEIGKRLKVSLTGPRGLGMRFKSTILKAEVDRELRWVGRLLVPGLFEGEHFFIIEPLEGDRTRFIQGEIYTGVLVPFMTVVGILSNARIGFKEMNQALKERVENSTGQ